MRVLLVTGIEMLIGSYGRRGARDDVRPTLTSFGDGSKPGEVSQLPGVQVADAGCVIEDERPDFGDGCCVILRAKQCRQLQNWLQVAKTELVVQSAEYRSPEDECKYTIAPVPRWTLPMLSERRRVAKAVSY